MSMANNDLVNYRQAKRGVGVVVAVVAKRYPFGGIIEK